jgi:hypothetical protein
MAKAELKVVDAACCSDGCDRENDSIAWRSCSYVEVMVRRLRDPMSGFAPGEV